MVTSLFGSGASLTATPCAWAKRPVSSVPRAGQHTGQLATVFSSNAPWEASLSMLGVDTSGLPTTPRSVPRNWSGIRTRMLGGGRSEPPQPASEAPAAPAAAPAAVLRNSAPIRHQPPSMSPQERGCQDEAMGRLIWGKVRCVWDKSRARLGSARHGRAPRVLAAKGKAADLKTEIRATRSGGGTRQAAPVPLIASGYDEWAEVSAGALDCVSETRLQCIVIIRARSIYSQTIASCNPCTGRRPTI